MKSSKPMRIIFLLTIALSIVFCVLLTLTFIIKTDEMVDAAGFVETDAGHDVRASSDGIIERVFFHEGSEVNQGDVIALLVNEALTNQIEDIKLDILRLQERRSAILSRLNYLKTAAHSNEIKNLLINLTRESLAMKAATTEREVEANEKGRLETLLAEGLASQKMSDQALLRYRLLEIKEDQQRESLSRMEQEIMTISDRHKEELHQLTLELEQNGLDDRKTRLQLAHFENRAALSAIHSPRKGILIFGQERDELIGRQLRPGDKIAELIDLSSMVFKAAVPETHIRRLKEGQKVNLEIKALPYQKFKIFKGVVLRIAKRSSSSNANENTDNNTAGRVEYDVKVSLIDNSVDVNEQGQHSVFYLKPGLSGVARIIINHDLRLIYWLRIQLFGNRD
jgi:multidrug resistance efflux pump